MIWPGWRGWLSFAGAVAPLIVAVLEFVQWIVDKVTGDE